MEKPDLKLKAITKCLNRVFGMGQKVSPTDADNSEFYAPLIELDIAPNLLKELDLTRPAPITMSEEEMKAIIRKVYVAGGDGDYELGRIAGFDIGFREAYPIIPEQKFDHEQKMFEFCKVVSDEIDKIGRDNTNQTRGSAKLAIPLAFKQALSQGNPTLIKKLWALWESLAESGELSADKTFIENYNELKKEVGSIQGDGVNEIQADINNKLTPFKNLLALLKSQVPQDYIDREVKQCEESLKYLQALSMQGDGWIPVSERLPEKIGYYSVVLNSHTSRDGYWNGKEFLAYKNLPNMILDKTTHWQPLPIKEV